MIESSSIKQGTHDELCMFIDTIDHNISCLKDAKQYDLGAFLTFVLTTKLNKKLQESWLTYSKDYKKVPDVAVFLAFLKNKMQTTPMTTISVSKLEVKSECNQVKKHKASVNASQPANSSSHCSVCKGNSHPLYLCPTFKSMSVENRKTQAHSSKACFNCLHYGHSLKECKNTGCCKKCSKSHHTMLHREQTSNNNVETNTIVNSTEVPIEHIKPQGEIQSSLSMTSQVILKGPSGKQIVVRALLDSGAGLSLVSQRIVKQLQLPKSYHSISISGVMGAHVGSVSHIVNLTIVHKNSKQFKLNFEAAVVSKVTCDLPSVDATHLRNLPHLKNLDLADPLFFQSGKVDLLLGCNIYQDLVLLGIRKGQQDQPVAKDTVFGWAILGRYNRNDSLRDFTSSSAFHVIPSPNTDALLQRFWEIEEVSENSHSLTHEESISIDHYNTTHVFSVGRYKVTLPRKPDAPKLGNSRAQALQRFFSNEKSLIRRGNWEAFQQVVQEYLDLGHAKLVPFPALQLSSEESYYMPMHGVVKESSSTTKLRVVFDASAKTTSGSSFNDTLIVGPTLYPNICDILIRFRTYPVAVSSDISKMYRAVELCEADQNFHRFLWRPDTVSEVKDYQMTRVTFGVASSPFVAIQSLQQTAHDFGDSFPLAKPHVFSSMYVDDCLAGANTPEEAIDLYSQLRELLGKGGFDLRKWRSSSKEVLDAIDPSLHEPTPVKTLSDNTTVQHAKALGMAWDSTADTLYVSVGIINSHSSTKREVISDIARTFDILGWMAPAIVVMKILFQRLWELKLGWDEEIPSDLQEHHQQWKAQLPLLKDKPFNRCYFRTLSVKESVELHGFCDASEAAYSAVVYVRATYSNGPPTVVLVTAKTKVAPLKKLSIPRLELCGAHLLAKLLNSVRLAMGISLDSVFAWCDSTIVLHWLDGSLRCFKTFVGNRISNILTLFPSSVWHHVPTTSNPADCASRGLLPQELLTHDLWWNGPKWLHSDPIDWPSQPMSPPVACTSELKTVCTVTLNPVHWIEGRFSNYNRLLRVNAWIHRFISNLKLKRLHKSINMHSRLSVSELNSSEAHLFSLAQNRHFHDELLQLCHDKPIKANSRLISLNPFIDKDYLLRVGGRLSNSSLSFDQKHPIILPNNDILTGLLVSNLHVSLCHCGPSLLISSVGSRIHIIGVRRLVRDICRRCVTCRRSTAKAQKQQMGQLPKARVIPSPPFTITGSDFAGPFSLKKGHTRKPVIIKAYLCIFVCFSTKATHLECVSDLSTEAFLAAFKRFIARRGLPQEIFSENGSNFKGAHNDLQKFYQELSSKPTKDSVHQYLLNHRIKWNFSPERAPHFGGLWEAAVKSAKLHLRRIIGQQILNFEEFSTVLCQIESCLNSRPLLSLSSHADDAIDVLSASSLICILYLFHVISLTLFPFPIFISFLPSVSSSMSSSAFSSSIIALHDFELFISPFITSNYSSPYPLTYYKQLS